MKEDLTKKAVTTSAEIAAFHPLVVAIWQEVFTPIIGEEQVAYMLATYQSPATILTEIQQGVNYFTLYQGTKLVGYTAYEEEEDSLYLSKLYLLAELRGQGYSSALFDWYEALAKATGKGQLRLRVNQGNQRSIAVYQHRGFQLVCEDYADIGAGFVMNDYIFEKKID